MNRKEILLIETTKLKCNKGSLVTELKVTSQNFSTANGKLLATEQDKKPNENIFPFGICSITNNPCTLNLLSWRGVLEKNTINKIPMLTEYSEMNCAVGGTIRVIDPMQKWYSFVGDDSEQKEDINKKENRNVVDKKNIINIYYVNAKGDIIDTLFLGEKVSVVIETKDLQGEIIEIIFKSNNDDFQRNYKIKVEGNTTKTPFFSFPLREYKDIYDFYDTKKHRTVTKKEGITHFMVTINGKVFKKQKYLLKFKTYNRNYEELLGILKYNGNSTKDIKDNYENHYIESNSFIADIVNSFITWLEMEEVFFQDIEKRLLFIGKSLWNTAVQQAQKGLLDDRPLYWARIKMEVFLKRHPLFKKDIDYEKSLVKINTPLEKIIISFEEVTRNYKPDFINASPEMKKILITGFDPFVLNPDVGGNPMQSNPSGIVALSLCNTESLGAYIQAMIIPVRYTDFDGSQEHNKGQGEGIVEKYIKPFIEEKNVDMIVTISQTGPKKYKIDRFSTASREGWEDNMNYTREKGHCIITSDEWIETTLPKTFCNDPNVYEDWEYNGKSNTEHQKPKVNEKLTSGSGGDFLSNEIFYRVAKLRKELNSSLPTGHFHIAQLHNEGELDEEKALELYNIVKQAFKEGIKGIK
ncbi:PAAR-like protein [Capnocytophaga sputigena]|jgi:putative secreted protein